MAAEGGDCGVVQEKCYAVAAKQWLANCRSGEAVASELRKQRKLLPGVVQVCAQMSGERTKEPLTVGSS